MLKSSRIPWVVFVARSARNSQYVFGGESRGGRFIERRPGAWGATPLPFGFAYFVGVVHSSSQLTRDTSAAAPRGSTLSLSLP